MYGLAGIVGIPMDKATQSPPMQNRTSYLQSDLEFFLLLWRPLDEYPGSKDLGQMRMRGSRRKERVFPLQGSHLAI